MNYSSLRVVRATLLPAFFSLALLAAFFVFAQPAHASGATWYVDANTGVDTNDGTTTVSAFLTIQKAVDKAIGGDTIDVAAGIYTEIGQIVINKDLSIVGTDKATTIIKPAQDTGDPFSGDARGWFLIGSGITFNMSGVTLDGVGKNICHGIYDYALGTIQDINVKNIGCAQYYGRGIYLKSNATVRNVRFENIERIGVFVWQGATAAVVDGITYIGKGPGDHLDYGIELENGAVATITNSTVSNNTGVAASDGSTSAGILVTTFFGPGTTATITGNTLTDNTDGIAVGFDGSDTSVVVAHNNTISGNTNSGIDSTNATVNATNNWWGNASGPLATTTLILNPLGTGNAAVGNVTFKPYYIDAGMTTLSSVPTTVAASDVTSTDATLNGTNGDTDASGHSFWVSTSTFSTVSSTPPAGVYSTLDLGSVASSTSFSALLSSITGILPVTASTTYYFAARSDIGGTWTPGAIQTFTTSVVGPSNVSALNASQASADTLIAASSTESTTPGQHIVGSLADLVSARALATATSTDSQAVVDGQVTALDAAIATYNAAIVGVDITPPAAFTVGAVTVNGGTIVAGKWNQTNTVVYISVPFANDDASLHGGTVQLQAKVGAGNYVNVGYTALSILPGWFNSSMQSLPLDAGQFEAIGLVDGDVVHFRAILTDLAGNVATGTPSVTTLTVDFVTPVLASINVSPATSTIAVGEVQQYTPTGVDQFGNAHSITVDSLTSSDNSIATVDSPSYTATGVALGGPVTITVNGHDLNPLTSGSVSGTTTLTVSLATQTISVTTPAPASSSYGTIFSVAATSTSGLAVAVTTSGVCTNIGNSVTMTSGSGTCTVHYNQAGDSNYNAATEVTSDTTATLRPLSITANDKSKTYGSSFSFGVEIVGDGLVTGDSVDGITLTSAGNNPTADVGTYPITPSGATGFGLDNYDITYHDGTLTVNKADAIISVTPYSLTYDGAPHTATVSATGVLSESLSSLLDLSGVAAHTDAGSYTDTWTFAGDNNYNASSSPVTDIIGKANGIFTSIAPYSVTYDGAPHTATGSAVGVLGETLSGLDLSGTTHTTAGSYPTDPWVFTDVTGNYFSTNFHVSDSIAKADSTTVVTCPASETYTGSALTPCSVSVTDAGGAILTPDPVYANNTNVGTASADYTFAGDTNHNGSTDSTKNFAITKADSVTTVSCPASETYTGSALTPCTTLVTGVGGFSTTSIAVIYTNNTNVGTASTSATFAGDANHNGSSDSTKTFEVTADTTPPSVTKLGNGASDYQLPLLQAGLFGATMTFSEKLSTTSRTAVENALTAGADKTLTFKWNDNNGGDGSKLRISVSTTTTATFANDVVADITDLSGNIASSTLLVDSALASTESSPDAVTGDATSDSSHPDVVITDPNQAVTVTVGSGTTDPTVDVSAFITGDTGVLPEITINTGVADVVIADNTTVTGPTGWDGVISAPTATTTSGNAPAGFSVGNNVIYVGSPDGTINFDQAVKLTLTGVTGTVAYKPAGSDNWQTITTQCNSATDHSNISAPGECYFTLGGDTIIWTFHFTSFGGMNPNPAPSGGGGGGGPVGLIGTTNGGTGVGAAVIPTAPANTGSVASTGGEVLGAAAYNFASNLSVGSRGTDVTEFQKVLIAEGDLNIAAPTGYFGGLTKAAAIKYQKAHGIAPQSGYVGGLTRAELNKGSAPSSTGAGTGTGKQTLTDTQVSAIIGLLQSFGADASVISNVNTALRGQ